MKMEFNKLSAIESIRRKVTRAVASSAVELQERIKERLNRKASNIGNGGTPSEPGGPPAKKSGTLARSIQAIDVTTDQNKPTWRVGTAEKYAKIQEFGGRIVPKKAKFLAVPVGVAGQRAARDAKGDLRSLQLRVQRTASGKLLLVRDVGGRHAKTEILFVLVKSVTLPARPYFRPSIAEHSAALVDGLRYAMGDRGFRV